MGLSGSVSSVPPAHGVVSELLSFVVSGVHLLRNGAGRKPCMKERVVAACGWWQKQVPTQANQHQHHGPRMLVAGAHLSSWGVGRGDADHTELRPTVK